MKLNKISYSEWLGGAQEWSLLDLELGQMNLIVGKNASGKSRTLNVIAGLARHLTSASVNVRDGGYKAEFEDNGKHYLYNLEMKNDLVNKEELVIDDKVVLYRGADGAGEIEYSQMGGAKHPFQAPSSILAAMARRDLIQHPFLEPLYAWASALRHYRFGSEAGKLSLALIMENAPQLDERDQAKVSGLFRHGVKRFGQEFVNALKDDMGRINYSVDDVFLKPPLTVTVEGPGELVCLCVKEADLPCYTDQFAMSDGMFRALTILIFVNYYSLSGLAGSLLIDDIGEGLDFERSCSLIRLLRDKALSSKVQLIMSTNDRFVMNAVPLQDWSVLQRRGAQVKARNYNNSKEVFDEFSFTGLSNFSFLEMDVIGEYDSRQEEQ